MDKKAIMLELETILTSVLGKEIKGINEETTAKEIDGWDSLNHLLIIEAIETHYKIKFRVFEIMAFKNIGSIIDIIEKKTL
jgi:acyl carrier protein